MASEADELRLTVTLVDNASEGVKKIEQSLRSLSGGQNATAFQQMRKHTEDLQRQIHPLGDDFKKAGESLLPFLRGIGGAATGMLAFGYAAEKGLDALAKYSSELVRLNQLSIQTGTGAATLKSMREQMEQWGLSAGQIARNTQGLADSMYQMTLVMSPMRQKLLEGLRGEPLQAMQDFLAESKRLAESGDMTAYANHAEEGLAKITKSMEAAGLSQQRIAERRKQFGEILGIPDLNLLNRFQAVTAEEEKAQKARDEAAQKYLALTTRIGQEWKKITDAWFNESITSSPLMNALRWIDSMMERYVGQVEKLGKINEEHPAPEGFWQKVNPFNQQNIEREKAVQDMMKKEKTVPHMQHGGIVSRATLAMIGEAGPEAVIPLGALGGGGADEHSREVKENTEQLKQLNDALRGIIYPGGGGMAAAVAGAGGAPGGMMAALMGGGPGGMLGALMGGGPGGGLGDVLGGIMGGGAGGGLGGMLSALGGGGGGGGLGGMLGGLGAGGGAGGLGGILGGLMGGGGLGGIMRGLGGLPGFGGRGGGGGGLGGMLGGPGGILRSITGGGMGGLGGMPGGGGGGGRRRGGGDGGGDGGGGGGGEPLGSLAEQRAKFAEELKNPETRRLLAASAAAEVGGQGAEATQSYIESVINRASSRGKSLTDTLRDKHYYPTTTTSKLDRPISGAEQTRIDDITKQVIAGSNVSGFATGNESGGVHSGGAPVTRDFGRGRERFVQENADKKWVQRQIAAAGAGGGGGQKYASLGGGGGDGGGGLTHGVPSQFAGDLTAMTLAGAQPHNIRAYMQAHHIDLSEATCGQFMAAVVKEHGGVPPQNPAVASNWNAFGGREGAGYSSDPNAINIAVKQGAGVGSTGSHVTGAVPIFGKDGQITGFRGVGVNQDPRSAYLGTGQYGRDVISNKPITIGDRPGQYHIRHEIVQPQTQVASQRDDLSGYRDVTGGSDTRSDWHAIGARGDLSGYRDVTGRSDTGSDWHAIGARGDLSGMRRADVDRQMTEHRVVGTGQIDVNVNAPRNTFTRASGGGLFKKVAVNRRAQMEMASTSSGEE
jgi:hypothetical protein